MAHQHYEIKDEEERDIYDEYKHRMLVEKNKRN